MPPHFFFILKKIIYYNSVGTSVKPPEHVGFCVNMNTLFEKIKRKKKRMKIYTIKNIGLLGLTSTYPHSSDPSVIEATAIVPRNRGEKNIREKIITPQFPI
jgi:hypothetical protein